jgi:hypothetical protein
MCRQHALSGRRKGAKPRRRPWQDDAVLALGEEETLKLVADVWARPRHRIGERLGRRAA